MKMFSMLNKWHRYQITLKTTKTTFLFTFLLNRFQLTAYKKSDFDYARVTRLTSPAGTARDFVGRKKKLSMIMVIIDCAIFCLSLNFIRSRYLRWNVENWSCRARDSKVADFFHFSSLIIFISFRDFWSSTSNVLIFWFLPRSNRQSFSLIGKNEIFKFSASWAGDRRESVDVKIESCCHH